MCLAIPAKLTSTEIIGDNRVGTVEFAGVSRSVFLDFVPEAEVGDYVLVHVGFAVSRLNEQEAQETYELLKRVGMAANPEPAGDDAFGTLVAP